GRAHPVQVQRILRHRLPREHGPHRAVVPACGSGALVPAAHPGRCADQLRDGHHIHARLLPLLPPQRTPAALQSHRQMLLIRRASTRLFPEQCARGCRRQCFHGRRTTCGTTAALKVSTVLNCARGR
ncbi:unnamed protein product, partial [Ixodes pacificus]